MKTLKPATTEGDRVSSFLQEATIMGQFRRPNNYCHTQEFGLLPRNIIILACSYAVFFITATSDCTRARILCKNGLESVHIPNENFNLYIPESIAE